MVLNGKGNDNGINEDTQKRVWAKAKELNYKPNIMARSLRTGRSYTLGLIVADISNAFYARMCRAVEDAASKRGYYVLFSSSDEKADREKELIQMLRDRLVDGIILSTTMENNSDILQLREEEFPHVLIDRFIPTEETPYVTADNYGGSKAAVKHLIEKGKERIGLLSISPSHLTSITERVRGYQDGLTESGLTVDDGHIIEVPYDKINETIREELPKLLSGPAPVQALYTLNNNLATAALSCLRDMGKKVPDDVALVSFDDIDLFRMYQPPITAVSQPIEGMGAKAVEVLIDKIEKGVKNKDKKDQFHLETDLIVRESCG